MAIDAAMEAAVDVIAAGASDLVTAMGAAHIESEAMPSTRTGLLRRHDTLAKMFAGSDARVVFMPRDRSRCQTHVEVMNTPDEVYLIARIAK